jgi:hypothetical protein
MHFPLARKMTHYISWPPSQELHLLSESKSYIFNSINWNPIIDSLSLEEKHSPASPFLERELAENFCLQYQKYLFLVCKYRGKVQFSPSLGMDIVWHAHILDTMAYHRDCQQLFGIYIHHYPYFGVRSEEDRENLEKAYSNTQKLFLIEFGEEI